MSTNNNLVNFRDLPVKLLFSKLHQNKKDNLRGTHRTLLKGGFDISFREFYKKAMITPVNGTFEITEFVKDVINLDTGKYVDIMEEDYDTFRAKLNIYKQLSFGNINLAFVHIDNVITVPGTSNQINTERNLNLTIKDIKLNFQTRTMELEFGFIPYKENPYDLNKMIKIIRKLIQDISIELKRTMTSKDYFKMLRNGCKSRHKNTLDFFIEHADGLIDHMDISIVDSKDRLYNLIFKTNLAAETIRLFDKTSDGDNTTFKIINEVSITKFELDHLLTNYNEYEDKKLEEARNVYLEKYDSKVEKLFGGNESELEEFSQMYNQLFTEQEEEDIDGVGE